MPEIARHNDVTVVQLGAKYDALDDAIINQFRDQLLEQADKADPPLLVIDMGPTKFIGSSFIEILFRAFKRVTERHGRLVLCSVDPYCAEVLRATRVDTIIDSYPSCESAVQALLTG